MSKLNRENLKNKYKMTQFYGFNWQNREDLNSRGEIVFKIWGPLCIRKKCFSQMESSDGYHYQCMHCDYTNNIDIDGNRLNTLVHEKFKANWRKDLKFVNLDKLPAINEKLEEKNKFYKVSIEHSKQGELRDVHILIGCKDKNGKKAHIIISEKGEIRFDKKDLSPSEEIKSVTAIIYKNKKLKL